MDERVKSPLKVKDRLNLRNPEHKLLISIQGFFYQLKEEYPDKSDDEIDQMIRDIVDRSLRINKRTREECGLS